MVPAAVLGGVLAGVLAVVVAAALAGVPAELVDFAPTAWVSACSKLENRLLPCAARSDLPPPELSPRSQRLNEPP